MRPRLTPSQTVGPYFAIALPWDDSPVADERGVLMEGRVLDGAGEPVPDALVEVWEPESRAFARSATDDAGRWRVEIPAAPRVDIVVFGRGLLRHLVTRAYLGSGDGDPDIEFVPPERRETLRAEVTDAGYSFDIHIQGPRETVFFDV